MQVYLLEVSLLKELVDGSNGLKPDMVSFSNHCFVFLVHSWHHLPTQSAQLRKIYLQLSGQDFCFPFGAGNKVFFFLDALLGGPDLSLEII
jgi:hypothetical protein